MRQQHGECFERREPTIGTAQPSGMANRRPLIPDRAAIERAERARRRDTASRVIKFALWVAVWLSVLWLSEVAARALQPHDPQQLTYVFEASGTAALLLIAFWRTAWRLMWWSVGLVIVLAIIKGAFLIVFAL